MIKPVGAIFQVATNIPSYEIWTVKTRQILRETKCLHYNHFAPILTKIQFSTKTKWQHKELNN